MSKNKIIAILVVIIIFLVISNIIFFLRIQKYTVTFDSRGGTEIESQRVREFSRAKEPSEPSKEGFSFAGWYYADDENTEYSFKTRVDKDINLVAKWVRAEKAIARVSIVAEKKDLNINEELELNLRITPGNADIDGAEFKWTSSDEEVLTVDQNGKVKAIKSGKATVTVIINDVTSNIELTVGGVEEPKIEQNTNTGNDANKDKNTSKDKNASKNSNTTKNTSKNTNTNTNTNTNPEEPKPITYKAVWGAQLPNDIVGQYYLYIQSSEGKKVSGTATITFKGGKTQTVSIPASGAAYVKSTIVSISNVKGN